MCDLGKNFPNIRRLSFIDCSISKKCAMENSFTNLTHLQLEQIESTEDYARGFSLSEIVRILNANRELHSLGVHFCSGKLLDYINKYCPNIVNLSLGYIYLFRRKKDKKEIRVMHVKRAMLKSCWNVGIPLVFDSLKELKVKYIRQELIPNLSDFIEKHKHKIEVLDISFGFLNDLDFSMFPQLENLQKTYFTFPSEMYFRICGVISYGMYGFIKANRKLQEIIIDDVEKKHRQDFYATFTISGLTGWRMEILDPDFNGAGHIRLIKHPYIPKKREDFFAFFERNCDNAITY